MDRYLCNTVGMSRARKLLFLVALGIVAAGCRSVGPGEVQLPGTLDPRLTANAQACISRLNRDRERAQSAMQTSDLLLLLGAVVGAAGSLLAAFLTKPSFRRASAVVGALGALTAAATKTLDDPSEILTKRARAERHWIVGYKLFTQTVLASEPPPAADGPPVMLAVTGEPAKAALSMSQKQRQRAYLYVLERFIDCTADAPPEQLEDLPISGFLTFKVRGDKDHAPSVVLGTTAPPGEKTLIPLNPDETQDPGSRGPFLEEFSSHGYSVVSWRDGEVVYEMVTELDEDDIRRMLMEREAAVRKAALEKLPNGSERGP
ncbi:hypothetical protein [Pyxidicoccus sp. MSG2]|uniref:hypothetical protein n=1 Tax=Pyxidicoccus sp. MSG2 TaxID=2996790 RepID=UPI0022708D86|nr:hypothetical protein [Pyxidicoccus sp. MSG2]MCY1022551.1 hypothetical protein [Pyxidicoccus sp. MSG2]